MDDGGQIAELELHQVQAPYLELYTIGIREVGEVGGGYDQDVGRGIGQKMGGLFGITQGQIIRGYRAISPNQTALHEAETANFGGWGDIAMSGGPEPFAQEITASQAKTHHRDQQDDGSGKDQAPANPKPGFGGPGKAAGQPKCQ